MAQITLTAGETQGSPAFPLGTSNTFADAPGNAITNETIYVANGTQAFGANFNDGGDTIVLSGSASQFTISRSGSTITLTNGTGLTVTFPAPDASVSAANAPRFVFNSGSPGNTADDQTFTLSNTGTAINFTNTAAGSTPLPVTSTPVPVTPTPPPPTVPISVTSTNVVEGSGNIVYTLTLATAQTTPVTITVNVGPGATNGATAGVDFTAITNQSITFAPGETVKTVTVTVLDDAIAEGAETVTLTITGVTPTAGSTVTATIADNETGSPPNNGGSFQLTTGSDTPPNTALNDRFTGVQDITLPGKLLSSNDVVNGGDGSDLIELFNTRDANNNTVANVLEDGDLTNVTSVERLESNYNQITLGTEALQAGLVSVNTTSSDFRTTSGVGPNPSGAGQVFDPNGNPFGFNGVGGRSLGLGTALILDPAYVQALNATMSNLSLDTVALNFASAAGSSIDTGSSGTRTDVNGVVTTFNPIDNVSFTGTITNPLRVTFTSAAVAATSTTPAILGVGDGSARNNAGALAVAVQSEDGSDGLTGGIVRFDDEGIRFTGAQFDVRDVSGTARGTFGEVVLGTSTNDTVTASVVGSYINLGNGNDTATGSSGADFLVGGAGNDTLSGGGGVDSILGGDGNDLIIGGGGIDALLNGQEGSDVYFFDIGDFVASEPVTDTGTTGTDFLQIRSNTAIADAQFAGRASAGVEGLATDVVGAGGSVTVGANAQAAGIVEFLTSDDNLDASAYTVGVTVRGQGSITTGTGADTVALQSSTNGNFPATVGLSGAASRSATQAYLGAVVLGAGNDTLFAGFALNNNANNTLTGGAGTDTLVLGGANAAGLGGTAPTNAGAATAYVNPFGAAFTGFEAITIAATGAANQAVAYTLTFGDTNVEAGTTFAVDGSTLRSGVTLTGGGTANEVLTVDASALTGTRAVNVTGGASADVLTGGAGNDTLTGGLGNDTLSGNGGVDTITGGAGDDIISGGAGLDVIDGGDGGDIYLYADGEFVAGETLSDTGTGGIDVLNVTSSTPITDAQFAGRSGVEGLESNVTTGVAGDLSATGVGAEVTLGAAAQAAGISFVANGNDDVDASGYTTGFTAFTTGGSVTTGSGADTVNVLAAVAAIRTGAGDDIVNGGYFTAGGTILTGGAGSDTLNIGGPRAAIAGLGNTTTVFFNFGTEFTQFERLTIRAAEAAVAVAGANNDTPGNAISFNVTTNDANVDAGQTLFVDASSLVAVTTGLGADNELGGTADTTSTPILTFNGAAETNGSFDVTGGAGADVLTGGQGADFLRGGAGNDTLNGGAGGDTLEGGDGNDILRGQAGFDTIRGGAGDDRIEVLVTEFNSDNDNVDGGAGNDTLQLTGTVNGPQDIADVGFNGRFANIEQVTLVGAVGGTQFTYNAGFFSETAGVRIINLGANTSGSAVSVSNYSTAGATLNDTLVNGNNATFTGSNFADTFNLGVTNTATGGGTDIVRGGGGDDTFNFGSGLTGADLADGGTGNDTLNISGNGTSQTVAVAVSSNVVFTPGFVAPTTGIFSIETINLATGLTGTAGTVGGAAGTAGTVTNYNVTVGDSAFETATSTLTVNGGGLRAISTGAGADATFGTGDDVTTVEFLDYDGSTVTGGRVQNVTGGAGADFIDGGAGNDTLNGGAGIDAITGGGGVDTIDGGTGDDTLSGGAGNDIITGGTGSDTITGGAGADTINLGTDGARDTVIIATGDAPRADIVGIEQINGFQTGSRGAGVDAANPADDTYTATADLIQFGAFGLINENSTSITNGVVQQGSVLQNAINSSTSLLAAIQLVEQEFNADAVLNQGVIAFTYGGNTYVGVIEDTDPTAGITEAFTSIVQINGLSGVTGLIDDAAIPGNGLGLYI